jgi:hypothetical protein
VSRWDTQQRTVNPYTSIPNETLRDERLSWGARGLLCWALTHSDEWTTTRQQMMDASPGGRDQVQRYLNELTAAGYRRVIKYRSDGRWRTIVEWHSSSRGPARRSSDGRFPGT